MAGLVWSIPGTLDLRRRVFFIHNRFLNWIAMLVGTFFISINAKPALLHASQLLFGQMMIRWVRFCRGNALIALDINLLLGWLLERVGLLLRRWLLTLLTSAVSLHKQS